MRSVLLLNVDVISRLGRPGSSYTVSDTKPVPLQRSAASAGRNAPSAVRTAV